MSSSRYEQPLRIELRPSRYYLRLIRYSHFLTALFACYLLTLNIWLFLLFPIILCSYRYVYKNYQNFSLYVWLRMHTDGRYNEYLTNGGQRNGLIIGRGIGLWKLYIIPVQLGDKRQNRLLFADAMSNTDWHRLKLFVGFALRPKDAA